MAENICYLLLVLVAMACSLVFTRGIMRAFSRFRSRELKAGKELIYRHFPRKKKPLGGGVAIFAALLTAVLLGWLFHGVGLLPNMNPQILGIWLVCGLAFGGIGFIDDWRKVNAARGLSEWAKLFWQITLGTLFTIAIVAIRGHSQEAATTVFFPFIGWIQLGYLFLPFGILVIVGATNAVNLTDGLDGLAGSSLAISFIGFLLLGVVLHFENIPLLAPLLTIAALLGFLVYNKPTARVIMGDTGALGLGAALGALALISRTEWLLLLFAAPFIIDTLSVLIQVSVIKFFRGPVRLLRHQTTEVFRPFLCTPLHHHFQWLTWGPWPILALFSSTGLLSVVLALLAVPATDGYVGYGWFWLAGLLLQGAFLAFAALQKVIRANYFLGLELPDTSDERVLALYKGLPIEFFGVHWYAIETITSISESMIDAIAAESILWRNISEIEAHAALGKIYAEYKMFDEAASAWEQIPMRNLLIRENLVVQLGKIYFGRDELLRAIKLWEQLPPSRLARVSGLPETIQSAKVRVGHLAGRLYHQARDHAKVLSQHSEMRPSPVEVTSLISELEGALRYTQDLRDLLGYERQKAEGAGEFNEQDNGQQLYQRMEGTLSSRNDELHEALTWAQGLLAPQEESTQAPAPLHELASAVKLTPAALSRALNITGTLRVASFTRITKPSRNSLFRIVLDDENSQLPQRIIAKCFQEEKVTFFSACYRREHGVLQLLQEADVPVPRVLGGHIGSRQAVLFMEDLGTQDLSLAMQSLPADDRAGRIELLRRGIETLVALRVNTLPLLPRLDREIAKIVKEVLTPEYYLNTMTIALNRIIALERRQLSAADRGKLEIALRPLIARLLDTPKTFIHFEYTPGNLHLAHGKAIAVDFEQSTMGPSAFDVATLLYSPDADLTRDEVDELVAYYHDLLPDNLLAAFAARPDILTAAAIVKLLFYAGSAANFYRKFEDGARLAAMEWYLRTADSLLMSDPEYFELAQTLRRCWHGQTHLPV